MAKKHRLDRNQLSVDGKKHRLDHWSSEERKSQANGTLLLVKNRIYFTDD